MMSDLVTDVAEGNKGQSESIRTLCDNYLSMNTGSHTGTHSKREKKEWLGLFSKEYYEEDYLLYRDTIRTYHSHLPRRPFYLSHFVQCRNMHVLGRLKYCPG